MSKCYMAKYCIYSDDGIKCEAGNTSDKLVENCPYLNAVGEIARLSADCLICGSNYNQDIISILIRYHDSEEINQKIIETKFCPNCGRRLNDE